MKKPLILLFALMMSIQSFAQCINCVSTNPYSNVLLGGNPDSDEVTVSYQISGSTLYYKVTVNTSSTYTADIWSDNGGDNSAYFLVYGDGNDYVGGFECIYTAQTYPGGQRTYSGTVELGGYSSYDLYIGGLYITPGPTYNGASDVVAIYP